VTSALHGPTLLNPAHLLKQAGISYAEDGAADCGCRLERAETEHGNVGEGVTRIPRAPEGLGAVFHQQQAVPPRECGDGTEIEATTEEVCDQHRAGARRERPLQELDPRL
jgi:hypothetical protein